MTALKPPGPAIDPSFSSVRILLHFNGTNGSTTFTNSASASGVGTFTNLGGSIVLDTSVQKFGSASAHNTGGGGASSVLVAGDDIGTGDFTLEGWMLTANAASTYFHADYGQNTNPTTAFTIRQSSSSLRFVFNGTDRITGGTILTSTWQYIAVARASGVTKMYLDGPQVGSNYTDGNTYTGNGHRLWIGRDQNASNNSVAWYDDWRLTVGVARYTGSSMTVPTAAHPDS